jgi:hypothetical protein
VLDTGGNELPPAGVMEEDEGVPNLHNTAKTDTDNSKTAATREDRSSLR